MCVFVRTYVRMCMCDVHTCMYVISLVHSSVGVVILHSTDYLTDFLYIICSSNLAVGDVVQAVMR